MRRKISFEKSKKAKTNEIKSSGVLEMAFTSLQELIVKFSRILQASCQKESLIKIKLYKLIIKVLQTKGVNNSDLSLSNCLTAFYYHLHS